MNRVARPQLTQKALGVLRQASVTRLGEAEHSLDHADAVFDFGANTRFGAVLTPLHLIDHTAMAVAAVGEVLSIRCVLTDHRPLSPIRLVAIYPRLVPVQQLIQPPRHDAHSPQSSSSRGSAWSCYPRRCATSSQNTTA